MILIIRSCIFDSNKQDILINLHHTDWRKPMQHNKIQTLTTSLLTGSILLLTATFVFLPKHDFSENENRYLASIPAFSLENVKSGQYMEDINAWLSDHFPLRDFFMGLKTDTEMIWGKREINNVYIAADDYLIEVYDAPANTQRIADTFSKFYEKIDTSKINTHLMLVPTANYTLRNKLPKNAPTRNQMDTANAIYEQSGIPAIDCSSFLAKASATSPIYYRTDHHWTTYGAYQGYLAYCDALGLTPVLLDSLNAQTVTNEFYGTIYSKVNDYRHAADSITIYTNPADSLTVSYFDSKEVSDSLYNPDYLNKKDKYSLFLDNLHTLIEITNDNATSDSELVLIKDSYANCMVPFLAHHYKKIYVFDTRYYKEGPSAFIEEHPSITDVLLLYNMNTIDTDSGIRGIY